MKTLGSFDLGNAVKLFAPLGHRKLFLHRYGGVLLLGLVALCLASLTRLTLLLKSHAVIDKEPLSIIGVFALGFLFDLVTISYFAAPLMLYLTFLPQRIFVFRYHRYLSVIFFFTVVYGLLIVAVTEYFFWAEFGVRFNFIAVDYVAYTAEVLGNIRESYPLPLILFCIFLADCILVLGLYVSGCITSCFESQSTVRSRVTWSAAVLIIFLVSAMSVSDRLVSVFENTYEQELAKNGIHSLFYAFRNNELDYDQFYLTEDNGEAFHEVRQLVETENSSFSSSDPASLTRLVKNGSEAKRYNVIQITVESLSAKFMGAFGSKRNLTPNLDALAREGILFTRLYASGTRTDRGMEALALSVPPTPGRSIIKRPHNENLFSLGSLFRANGYDTAFIYGGYGYFDNMNYFFQNNGFKVIDRAAVSSADVTYANIWGACDEDLFKWVLDEADRSHAAEKPFFHFVMTTSNHRPFTYPDGRIDIPSHSGRDGSVKYSDFAIGQFIRQAMNKPWFSNTLFVIVADHCANSAGKAELPINQYRIPLIFYNPQLLKPQKVSKLCSQIDYAPTLLGVLRWSYESEFYGKDIFRMHPEDERALIGNYQKLGYMKNEELTVLKPIRQAASYHYDLRTGELQSIPRDARLIGEAIAYYQTSSYLFHHRTGSPSE